MATQSWVAVSNITSSCYSHQLEQHLQACNAKEPTHLPYYSKNVNAGSEDEAVDQLKVLSLDSKPLSELTDDQLMKLINLVLEESEGNICF